MCIRDRCTRDGIPARFGGARTSVERELRLPGLTIRREDRYTVTSGLLTDHMGPQTVKIGHLSFSVGPMAVILTVHTGLRTVALPVPVRYALWMDRTGLTIGHHPKER